MWAGILIILAIGIILLFVLALLSSKSRNRQLNAWACSVALTKEQQSAMWELWKAFKAGNVPEIDPLSRLTDDDREHIKTICSAEYRPAEFGSANVLRVAQFVSLMKRGYNPEQAAVIVGMTINMVGRKDIKIEKSRISM